MSALGQKATYAVHQSMSATGQKRTLKEEAALGLVRGVPRALLSGYLGQQPILLTLAKKLAQQADLRGGFRMQNTANAVSPMEHGIAAYLRNLSLQLDNIGRKCPDATTHEALVKICFDLADKAHVIETTFRVPKIRV